MTYAECKPLMPDVKYLHRYEVRFVQILFTLNTYLFTPK